MILSDEELNAAIFESGWTTRGEGAAKEFHALARAIERRVASKLPFQAAVNGVPVIATVTHLEGPGPFLGY